MPRVIDHPAYAGPRPYWTRPGVVVAAVIAALLVVMVFAIVIMRPSRDGDTNAGAPVATNSASGGASGAAEDSIPTTAPSDVTWKLVGKTAVPTSREAGPFQTTTTTAAGYAHTAIGALIAAAQLGIRSDFDAGRSVWEPTVSQQFVPGRNRDRLLDRMRSRSPSAAGQAPLVQIAGFLYQAYSADTAVIAMLYQAVDDPDSTYVTTLTVQWRDGDWRMVAPPDGSWAALVHWAEVWTGAVEWGPPSASPGNNRVAAGFSVARLSTVEPLVAEQTVVGLSVVDLGSSDYLRDPAPRAYDCSADEEPTGPGDVCGANKSDQLTKSERELYDKADKACKDVGWWSSQWDNPFTKDHSGKCFRKNGDPNAPACYIEEDATCDPIYGASNKKADDACDDVSGKKCFIKNGEKCYQDTNISANNTDCLRFYEKPGDSWMDKLILNDLKNSIKWAYTAIVNFWMKLPPPNLSTANSTANPVYWLRDRLDWLIGLTAVCSLIFAGAKLALQRDGREAAAVARGIVRLVILNFGGAAIATSLVKAGNLYSVWIMQQAMGNNPGTAVDSVFDGILGNDLSGVSDVLPTFVVVGLGFLLLASGLMQIVLLVTRDAGLMLLVGLLPVASGLGLSSIGAAVPRRYVRMAVGILLVQPTIATVAAFGMVLLDSDDGMTMFIGGVTLCLGVVAPFALPRLVAPVVGGGSIGNSDLDRGRGRLRTTLSPIGAATPAYSAAAGRIRQIGAAPASRGGGAAGSSGGGGGGTARGAGSAGSGQARGRTARFALGVVRNSASLAMVAPAVVRTAGQAAVATGKLGTAAVVTTGKTATGAFENGPRW
jgi:hypothetical protein